MPAHGTSVNEGRGEPSRSEAGAESSGTSAGRLAEFARLYEEHAADVHRFALFLSGDSALADDLVSETFVRLWSARTRVDLTTVRGYLFAIARNLYLHEMRRTGRMTNFDARSADAQPDPEMRAEARSELRVVLAALQCLPEVDRAAVLMRAEGDLSYEEIAAALGISLASVKVKIHRARLRLAEARKETRR